MASFYTALLVIFALIVNIENNTQNKTSKSIKLNFIDDYPVKIDGECSFYTYDTTNLKYNRYVLIISAKNAAFIRHNEKYIVFRNLIRAKNKSEYTDVFSNENYKLIIDIDSINKSSRYNTIRSGKMTVIYKNDSATVAIHGNVQAHDSYGL